MYLYTTPMFVKFWQLSVAVSRIRSCRGLKILIYEENRNDSTTTTNDVYEEMFQNTIVYFQA